MERENPGYGNITNILYLSNDLSYYKEKHDEEVKRIQLIRKQQKEKSPKKARQKQDSLKAAKHRKDSLTKIEIYKKSYKEI